MKKKKKKRLKLFILHQCDLEVSFHYNHFDSLNVYNCRLALETHCPISKTIIIAAAQL